MQSIRTNTLRVDNPIRFGNQGNYLTFAPQGFAGDEHADNTWNDGCVASLQLRILAIGDDTRLRIEADPFVVPDKLPVQMLNIYLNGLWIGFACAQRFERMEIELPAAYVVPTVNRLSFVMPNATRPSDIDAGPDRRSLAFSFREIALIRAA